MAKFNKKQEIKRSPIRQQRTSKRVLIKKKGKLPDNAEKGVVVASIGKVAVIKPESYGFEKEFFVSCYIAGTIITPNEHSSIIAVGDVIYFIRDNIIDTETNLAKGTIVAVEERKSSIARKTPGKNFTENIIASNLDNILIFMAAANPDYNKRLIDRFLISAEAGGVKPAICVNKIDLFDDIGIFKEDLDVYNQLNIPLFFISAEKELGLKAIENFCDGKKTLLSGFSGSGKSTLINSLLGEEVQPVMEISEKTFKGKHMTTSVKMFKLNKNSIIIDSPGIREFGIIGIEKHDLSLYFHDFDEYFPDCKYSPCTHIHEPGCAVIEAVKNGEIDPERYQSYINIYESIAKIKYK